MLNVFGYYLFKQNHYFQNFFYKQRKSAVKSEQDMAELMD